MSVCTFPACLGRATGQKCYDSCKLTVNKKGRTTSTKKDKPIDVSQLIRNDASFYIEIWLTRTHVCFECGEKIEGSFSSLYMHHVLAKRSSIHDYSDYSKYRHCRWNIVICCWPCHTAADGNNATKVYSYMQKLLSMHNKSILDTLSPTLDFIK